MLSIQNAASSASSHVPTEEDFQCITIPLIVPSQHSNTTVANAGVPTSSSLQPLRRQEETVPNLPTPSQLEPPPTNLTQPPVTNQGISAGGLRDELMSFMSNPGIPADVQNAFMKYGKPILDASIMYKDEKLFGDLSNLTKVIQTLSDSLNSPDKFPTDEKSILDKFPVLKEGCKKFKDKICSYFVAHCEGGTFDKPAAEKLINQLEGLRNEAAETHLRSSTQKAALFTCYQVFKLWSVYQNLEKAQNVLKESKEEFPKISSKLKALQESLKTIKELQEEFLKLDESKTLEKGRVLRFLNFKLIQMSLGIKETQDMIERVKLAINNGIETLGSQQNEQLLDCALNSVQAMTSAFNVYRLKDWVSRSATRWGLASASISSGLALWNIRAYTQLGKAVEVHRQALRQCTLLHNEVNEIASQFVAIEQWFSIEYRKN